MVVGLLMQICNFQLLKKMKCCSPSRRVFPCRLREKLVRFSVTRRKHVTQHTWGPHLGVLVIAVREQDSNNNSNLRLPRRELQCAQHVVVSIRILEVAPVHLPDRTVRMCIPQEPSVVGR